MRRKKYIGFQQQLGTFLYFQILNNPFVSSLAS